MDGSGLVIGILKGHDQLMNLVLDDVRELLQGFFPPLFSLFHFPSSFPQNALPPLLIPPNLLIIIFISLLFQTKPKTNPSITQKKNPQTTKEQPLPVPSVLSSRAVRSWCWFRPWTAARRYRIRLRAGGMMTRGFFLFFIFFFYFHLEWKVYVEVDLELLLQWGREGDRVERNKEYKW